MNTFAYGLSHGFLFLPFRILHASFLFFLFFSLFVCPFDKCQLRVSFRLLQWCKIIKKYSNKIKKLLCRIRSIPVSLFIFNATI